MVREMKIIPQSTLGKKESQSTGVQSRELEQSRDEEECVANYSHLTTPLPQLP